jgi:hypothetical protein
MTPKPPQIVTITLKFRIDDTTPDAGPFTRAVVDIASRIAHLTNIEWMGGEVTSDWDDTDDPPEWSDDLEINYQKLGAEFAKRLKPRPPMGVQEQ